MNILRRWWGSMQSWWFVAYTALGYVSLGALLWMLPNTGFITIAFIWTIFVFALAAVMQVAEALWRNRKDGHV